MRLCGLEFTPPAIDLIRDTLAQTPSISRRALSRRVCESVGWRAANGNLKEMSCRKALLALHRQAVIELPASCASYGFQKRAQTNPTPLVEAAELGCELSDLGSVQLQLVTSRYCQRARVRNDLMDRYHHLGRGPLCGAQIRYLVSSPQYGYLGALGFSSATWSLQKRDEQIGWSDAAHRANLQRVVCNSRFLIVPTVRVPNLASHVLGQCVARIADDWKSRYGIEPVLLETFVDPQRCNGVSYRAANWLYVGQTSGRRAAQNAQGPKDIFIYPLSLLQKS